MANKFILKNKYGFTDEEISFYKDLNQDSHGIIEKRYISQKRYSELRKYLDEGSWRSIIHNKWISSIYFAQCEVPQPKSFGLLHPLYGIDLQQKPLLNAKHLENLIREHELERFVLKHIGGGKGDSVLIVKKIEKKKDGFVYITINQKRLGGADINDLLSHRSGDLEGYKIEEFLDSHESISRITGGGASSMRIYTFREKPNKTIAKLGFIRFGLPRGATDHLTNGATYATIDLCQGSIKEGISKVNRIIKVKSHQPTGEIFMGKIIPYWDNVVQLAEQAARSCPGLNWVGWDIVLSKGGPYLIEGNVGMELSSFQQSFGGLKENGILDDWIKHLDIPVAEEKNVGELDSWKTKYVRHAVSKIFKR